MTAIVSSPSTGHSGTRTLLLATGAAGFVLAIPLLSTTLRQPMLITIGHATAGLGIMLLLRAGLVSFGHALFFACGAYTVAFGTRLFRADIMLLLPSAILVSAALGALLAAILVRYRDIFFAMLNLAFSMVGYILLLKLYGVTGGSDGMGVRQPTVAGLSLSAEAYGWTLYVVAVLCLCGSVAAVLHYLASPPGEALGAIESNETRLEYLGISARSVLFVAYVASAGLAGLGGALTALATAHVTANGAYWTKSAEFVFMVLLGGTGSVFGPLLGSAFYEIIRSIASAYAANAWQLIMGVMLVGIILRAPDGIWGLARRLTLRIGEVRR